MQYCNKISFYHLITNFTSQIHFDSNWSGDFEHLSDILEGTDLTSYDIGVAFIMIHGNQDTEFLDRTNIGDFYTRSKVLIVQSCR